MGFYVSHISGYCRIAGLQMKWNGPKLRVFSYNIYQTWILVKFEIPVIPHRGDYPLLSICTYIGIILFRVMWILRSRRIVDF